MSHAMEEDSSKQTRIRQYGKEYKGEIIVFIHASGDGLKLEPIYKTLFKNLKYISRVIVVNKNKIKVQFEGEENRHNAIAEANTLAQADLKGCTIYIPAKYVEIQGVVSWPIGETIENFVSNGKGKFRNPMMKNLKVLDSVRLMKRSNEASNDPKLEDTSIVIITFEGNLLPDTLEIEKLCIPVREYRRREMFCVECKRYGHTRKRCNNKKLVNPAYLCMACNTNDHLGGSIQCPRRKVLEKKHSMTMKKLRKRTFAEMLKELDPTGEAHESPTDSTVPPMSFPSRKEEKAQKLAKKTEPVVQPPQKPSRQIQTSSSSNKYPPGYKKQNTSEQPQKFNDFTNAIIDGIKSFMMDINVPPPLQLIIIGKIGPYINSFIRKFTDSFEKTMLEFCSFK